MCFAETLLHVVFKETLVEKVPSPLLCGHMLQNPVVDEARGRGGSVAWRGWDGGVRGQGVSSEPRMFVKREDERAEGRKEMRDPPRGLRQR